MFPDSVKTVLTRLRDEGFDAYCVGGCVRDLLLGAIPHDWDISAAATPAEVIDLFSECVVIPTGLRHGTVTVLLDGDPIEITTFRTDGDYSDNRRPDSVRFTADLRDDLARRDFTVNALALSCDGEIIDFCGGRADIKSKVIRCVGDATERFREDALRILRALRFASVLGFSIDAGTSRALREEAARLLHVSAERVRAELTKMLCGANVGGVLRDYADVLAVVLPEITPVPGPAGHGRRDRSDAWAHTIAVVENVPAEPALRFAALFHGIGGPLAPGGEARDDGCSPDRAEIGRARADEAMFRLKFDRRTHARVLKLVERCCMRRPASKAAVKRQLNELGEETFVQLLQLQWADNLGSAPERRTGREEIRATGAMMREILAGKECFSLRDLAVNGDDLTALGLRGKAVGAALRALLDAVMDGALPNERGALLGEAERYAARASGDFRYEC
jgi:tRNA nucleotidyltransferase (CCA-adding enzyme)